MRVSTSSSWGLLASLMLAPAAAAADPVSPKQFERLHRLIKPHESEQKWKQVPWLADLWEARRQ